VRRAEGRERQQARLPPAPVQAHPLGNRLVLQPHHRQLPLGLRKEAPQGLPVEAHPGPEVAAVVQRARRIRRRTGSRCRFSPMERSR